MSDHEAKSRSIKELKAKKHHEKLSLLRASVKEIVHREKMEPQYVILFGSYARGDFNGFSDVDLIVVDHNRDQAERLACSIQEQGLADDVLTLNSEEWNQKRNPIRFSGNRSFKKVFASMSIPENPWFLQAEDDLKMAKLAFANGFYSQTCYHASQSAEKALKSIIIDLGELPPKTHALNRLKGMLSQLGLHTSDLEDLKLNFLTRMHTSTRYPSEDLPPVQLFDQSDGEECLEIAEKVINFTRTMKKGDG